MNIREALKKAAQKLESAGIGSAPLDAELISAFVMGQDRAYLLAHPEKELTERQAEKFDKLLARRQQREPLAYIIGKKSFYGLDFYVNRHVLVPRSETELLVEEILLQPPASSLQPPVIIDIGTGSGCIAISLAKNMPKATIIAIDKCVRALAVAEKNARRHKVHSKIKFLQGNLLQPLSSLQPPASSLIIVANLPYISESQYSGLAPEITRYEPKKALTSGKDGLDDCRRLLDQLAKSPALRKKCRLLLLEIDPSQANSIEKEIRSRFPEAKTEINKDLAGSDRMISAKI